MTLARALSILRQIRYREGWQISTAVTSYVGLRRSAPRPNSVFVQINARTQDAYHSDLTVEICGSASIPVDDADEGMLLRRVFDLLMRMEQHEVGEFFRYGDTRPFNPHVRVPAPR